VDQTERKFSKYGVLSSQFLLEVGIVLLAPGARKLTCTTVLAYRYTRARLPVLKFSLPSVPSMLF